MPRRPGGRRTPTGLTDPPPPEPTYTPQPQPPRPQPPTAEQVEQVIATSGTILGKTIPMAYGVSTVRGYIGAWQFKNLQLDLGIVFAFGEQDSIATGTTYINGEVITSATGVSQESVHVGDGSTGISALLTGMDEWVAGDTTKWKGYAHAVLRIDCRTSQLPGSFVFTSKLGGRKVAPIGGGAAAQSENLAVIGYDIMTSSDWAGVAAAKINETSWGLFEDWCGETTGDTKRCEWNGILTERDPDRALAIVLGLGLGYSYPGNDGKLALWAEMAPPAITGDWSAEASATITEDESGGEATSEVEADDWVYVGTNLRQVDSVTDDDTIVLKSVVTVSAVKVRPISNVYIEKRDWVQPPAATEANLLQTPDKYRVRFTDEDNAGAHEVTVQYGAGTAKIIEATLPGCSSASVATRHAETLLKVAHLQPYSWAGIVGNEIGTALEIGDVLLFDDDVLTMQAARVVPPIQARADGTYVLQLREFDPSAYSDDTAVTDTVPSLGTGYASNKAPVVVQIETVYSSTTYDLIGMGSAGIYDGRVVLGDTGRNAVFGSSDLRLPYGIPLYGLKSGGATVAIVQMGVAGGGADKFILGDGSEAVFINSSGEIILPDDGYFKHDFTVKKVFFAWSKTNTSYTLGNTDYNLHLHGDTLEFIGLAASGAVVPSTAHFDDGEWGLYKNTSGGVYSLCYRDGSDLHQVDLAVLS